jgi:hypothetical protein
VIDDPASERRTESHSERSDGQRSAMVRDPFGEPSSEPRRLPAATFAALTVIVLVVLIYFGSVQFKHFDSALVGYAVATVVAAAALVYRYTLWIGKPPTWRYFRAGWANFLSWRNFRRYATLIPKAWWTDILAQTFIMRRSFARWVMHMSIFWGVIISLLVTIPLTFGWLHFTLAEPGTYQMWVFGFAFITFPVETPISWSLFHALDFSAVLLLIGLSIAFWRRVTDAGLLATQRFGFDLLPLLLLFSIAVTGLALTASQIWWEGRFYWFLALTHEVTVVAWFLSLPFGKFFHIVERPASIGVTLYQTVNQDLEQHAARDGEPPLAKGHCRRCGERLPSAQFVSDLKASLYDLGQAYDLGEGGGMLQDYCPTCKRILRGQGYYRTLGNRFL